MKTQFVITSLFTVFALHGASADQPNFRNWAQNADNDRRGERAHGIKGFFRGVLGEIRQGHKVIRGGIHEVHDGIKERISGRDDEPEYDGPTRFGYQSPPPPPIYDDGGFRMPRDPGPPAGHADPGPSAWNEDPRARFNPGPNDATLPTSGPRERTQSRKPESPAISPAAQRPTLETTTTTPRLDREPAPVQREAPVIDRTSERPPPEIVSPKKSGTPPSPPRTAPSPRVEKTPAPPKEMEPVAPRKESKPIARDEAGRPLPDKPDFPTATATKDPSIVLSPYPPYDLLDVQGMAPGSLAKDPATGQVFRVP